MRQLRKVTGKFSNCQNSNENNYFNAIKSNSVFNRDSGYEHGCHRLKSLNLLVCLQTIFHLYTQSVDIVVKGVLKFSLTVAECLCIN